MRLMILGGGGAVGSAIARYGARRGLATCALLRPTTSRIRLATAGVEITRGDLEDSGALRAALRRFSPDLVVCAAFPSGQPEADGDRQRLLLSMARATLGLFAALRDVRFGGRLVLLGSAMSYGAGGKPRHPSDPMRPRSFRGAAKAAESILAAQLAAELGIPLVEVRLFTGYGPFEQRERLVAQLLRAALTGGSVRLTARPANRDFIHYDDLAEACLAAGHAPRGEPIVFNACTGTLTSTHALADMVERLTGRALISAEPYARGDAYGDVEPGLLPDPASGIDWRPRIDLRAGLEASWEWAQSPEGRTYLCGDA